VAEDTPSGLASRLEGGERIRLKALAAPPDAVETLQSLPEVNQASLIEPGTFELECTMGVDCRPAIAQVVVEKGWGLLELYAVSISLEDIFLELTGDQEVM
jgi:ABC-2 type transport system ATP-binding protein